MNCQVLCNVTNNTYKIIYFDTKLYVFMNVLNKFIYELIEIDNI